MMMILFFLSLITLTRFLVASHPRQTFEIWFFRRTGSGFRRAGDLAVLASSFDAFIAVLVQARKVRPYLSFLLREQAYISRGCESGRPVSESHGMELVLVGLHGVK
jgi:hypothetical protein